MSNFTGQGPPAFCSGDWKILCESRSVELELLLGRTPVGYGPHLASLVKAAPHTLAAEFAVCAPPLLGPSASETLEKRPSSLRPLDAAQDKDKATQAPIHTKADLTGGLSWIECMHKPYQSSR